MMLRRAATGAGGNLSLMRATLISDADTPLPGVTALDPEAIIRGIRPPTPPRRSKILAWITGDQGADEEARAAPGSLEPPPPDVRREML